MDATGVESGGNGDADGIDAAASCSASLATGCATSNFASCPATWGAAHAFCAANTGNYGVAQTDCGTYLWLQVTNVDVGCAYYYDKSTGDLVAVFCSDPSGNSTCRGGPPGFTQPACGTPVWGSCATDAGTGD